MLKRYSFILFFLFSFTSSALELDEIPETFGRAGKIGLNFELSYYLMSYNTIDSEKWYYADESFHLFYNSHHDILFKLGILYFYTERLSYSFFLAPQFEVKKELDYPIHIAMGVELSFFILDPLSLDLSISTRYDSYDFLLSNGITYYFLNFESNQIGISDTINILIKQNLVIENYISLKWNILF